VRNTLADYVYPTQGGESIGFIRVEN